MLGVEDERDLHGANPLLARGLPMQQLEKVSGQRVLSRFHIDASSVAAEVMPVKQHRPNGGEQYIGALNSAGGVMVIFFRQRAAQGRDPRAQHVHGVGRGGQLFQHHAYVGRQASQPLQFLFVRSQLGGVWQLTPQQ